ncbi:MAG: hypothetical protein F6K47_21030 [Symploca sp. SIO2E6]|nr:hypothetical protein [Symploca sp. SIO2E6]
MNFIRRGWRIGNGQQIQIALNPYAASNPLLFTHYSLLITHYSFSQALSIQRT